MFTKGLVYALRGLLHLAALRDGAVCEAKTIADAYQIPPAYLAKIFGAMARAGIVRPVRGLGGGYALNSAPSEISLRAVIEAINGPLTLGFDAMRCRECVVAKKQCPVHATLRRTHERIAQVLDSVSVQDMLPKELGRG